MRTIAIILLFLGFYSLESNAQKLEYHYRDASDSSRNCYLKYIPTDTPIKGLFVRDYSRLPDASRKSPYRYIDLALENGYIVLITVTSSYFPELYFDDKGPALLDDIIHEVLTDHDLPKDAFVIGGLSASGTRALRYGQYCEQGKSKYGHKAKGVFMVDSPLDMERFYRSSKRLFVDLPEDDERWEEKLMKKTFKREFGGGPDELYETYRDASVFCQTDAAGGNAKYYANLPMLIYHEPDIDQWMERGMGYYDINSFDIVAFVVKVRKYGNENIKLVTTTGKGFSRSSERKPHSWTIVDEDELIAWVNSLF